MSKLHLSVWKMTLQNSGYSPSCFTKITQRSGKQTLSHRTSFWHKKEPQTVLSTCTKSRAQWNSQNTYGQMHDWNHLEGRTRSINQNAENQEKASPRRSHKRRDPLSRAISHESLSGSIQQVLEDRHHSSSVQNVTIIPIHKVWREGSPLKVLQALTLLRYGILFITTWPQSLASKTLVNRVVYCNTIPGHLESLIHWGTFW